MTKFAIFANGTYWGIVDADTSLAACQSAADEWGTEGNTDGLRAFEVTDDEAAAVDAWADDGADAAEIPDCVSH